MSARSRVVLAYVAAVLCTAALAAISQTQFNLHDLTQLGVPVPLEVRLRTTAADVYGFGQTFAALTALALLLALPVATKLASHWQHLRTLIFVLAGALAIACALALANAAAPMPTLIAADRYLAGRMSLMLCGSVGALLFAWLSRPRVTHQESSRDA